MNGRVYDPVVGRFVSPDPWIQDATNSQSFNRYTYVWNNPLRYTDPTGEFTELEKSCGRCSIITFGSSSTADPATANAPAEQSTTNAAGLNTDITELATPEVGSEGLDALPAEAATDNQQQNSTQQASDAGDAGNTSNNLNSGAAPVSMANAGDDGRLEEVTVCRTRSGGECGGGRNKWTTADFLKHYAFGFGALVNLRGTGLGGDFRNSRSVRSATRSFEQEVMQGPVFNLSASDTARINVTNDGDIGSPDFFPFNTPSLFSIGDSSLSMRAECVSGWCSFIYSMNDRFVDALDIHDRIDSPNLDIGIPYNIHYKWIESRTYGH